MSRVRSAFDRFLSIGAGDLPAELAGKVRSAQIAAVRRYTPWMMAANVASAALIAGAFAGSRHLPVVLAWATGVCLVALYAIARWWPMRARPSPDSASIRGVRRTVLHAVMLGACWAFLPAMFTIADMEQRVIIGSVVAGMLCGSGFALATIAPAALAFSGMLALGSTTALVLSPGFTTATLTILNAVYLAVIFTSSLSLADVLRARFEAQVRSVEQRDYIGLLLNDFEEHAADWLWMVDSDWRVRHVSSRIVEILGLDEAQLVGQRLTRALPHMAGGRGNAQERDRLRGLLRAMRKREAFRDREIAVVVRGAQRLWSVTAKPVFDARGEFLGYRGVGRDVTQASEARRKIEYLAHFDVLTGVANRASFNDQLAHALFRLKTVGTRFAVLLLDLDRFKVINDTQGHPAGDELLRQVAARLGHATGEGDLVARLGGDEFALLLAEPRSSAEVETAASRLIEAIAAPFALSTGPTLASVSIGISFAAPDLGHELDADALMRHADLALYRAKSEGRGRFCFFEPELDAAARRRHRIETDLRAALDTEGLRLAFQPQVDAQSRRIVGFEALARWTHAELGPIAPTEFIPLAEERGLIGKLGAWALVAACRAATQWPADVRIAVNLSPAQFRTPAVFDDVRKALEATGLPPGRLEIEITETVFLDPQPCVMATLDALRRLGARIALDDFGAGYSSLSYLRRHRFDKIKIDRSFVEGVDDDSAARAIVGAILCMAGDLGLDVCVEGVETAGQMRALQRLGCDQIQGFHIARPLDADAALAMLRSREAEPPKRLAIGA
ncbi:MAG: EAL domain-containing protein [Rhizobiales bacterium]|nr:EAL domain-containing protein [Hyphomicrobiales bacterium]